MRVFQKNSNIFHLLSEAILEGTIVVNQELIIVSMNRRAEVLFGYEPDELLGQPLSKIIPDKYKISHQKHATEYFSKGKQVKNGSGQGALWS